jgi:hypothetical protein
VLKKSFYFLVVSLGSMLLPVACFGESFTIEQVLSAPFPYGLTSASHAPRVAWVFDNKGERNIWVADAPGFVPRQVTRYKGDDGQAIASVRLTPDGKTVVYANRSRLFGSPESNSNGRLFLSSRDRGPFGLQTPPRAAKAASSFTAATRWKIRCRCLRLNH